MNPRPVIGIPTQTLEAIPDELPRCWVMSQRYVRVLASVGATPWVIPLIEEDVDTLRSIYDRLDGVFLTGGVDMDPQSYGEEQIDLCKRTDPVRDWVELTLIKWAIADAKPVLAVCRGAQVINVATGGTLYQDLAAQRPEVMKHDYFPSQGRYSREQLAHSVRLVRDSKLSRILGRETIQVNSMHHQGIKSLGSKLIASAYAPDGLIEAVESTNGHFLIGVQWHPEDLCDNQPCMHSLFEGFIDAAGSYASGKGG